MTQEDGVNEKVLDVLKKLMAHRDSAAAIGSQAEAEAFAQKVADLLNKHKMEEDDVHDHFAEKEKIRSNAADFSEFGLPKFHKRIQWTERLGRVIADNYFCLMMVEEGSNTLHFAGRPMDREVAVFVYITLARAAIKMSEKLQKVKELVRHLTDEPIDLRNFRASFYEGFVDGIRDRLAEQRKNFTGENPGFALVVTKSNTELDAWRKANTVPARGTPSGGTGRTNATAYEAGKAFAKEVDIQTGVGSGKATKRLA